MTAVNTLIRKRSGRPSSFAEQEYLLFVREVAQKLAHTAPHGKN